MEPIVNENALPVGVGTRRFCGVEPSGSTPPSLIAVTESTD